MDYQGNDSRERVMTGVPELTLQSVLQQIAEGDWIWLPEDCEWYIEGESADNEPSWAVVVHAWGHTLRREHGAYVQEWNDAIQLASLPLVAAGRDAAGKALLTLLVQET